MLKLILVILLYSSLISSHQSVDNESEIEEIKHPVEEVQTFSNNRKKQTNKVVNNNEEKPQSLEWYVQTPEEQEIYIQEMENLLNESDDGNDIIIKDVEDEASDLKEIIFTDDFDMWVEDDTTFANVELIY